jgi:hypothetical protein
MRTLKMIADLLLLFLAIAVAMVFRLFGWRPEGEADIQSLFPRKIEGWAVVSGEQADADPYPYIFVEADGSARELHASEREYLETRFLAMDGARPYTKWQYREKDGWGEIKGFLKRTRLPRRIQVAAAPIDDPSMNVAEDGGKQFLRDKGFEVTENADGSFTAAKPRMFSTEI